MFRHKNSKMFVNSTPYGSHFLFFIIPSKNYEIVRPKSIQKYRYANKVPCQQTTHSNNILGDLSDEECMGHLKQSK